MTAVAALRTPEARFADLPDWPYAPNYVDDLPGYEGLRLHYIDEGPKDAPVFYCQHGEPSWAYLYRRMIPVFLAAGARVVAPDFFGFGRSDKPTDPSVYTPHFHRGAILALIRRLDLKNVTLVVQDWGGLIGLTLPLDDPERYRRLIVMNTAFATGAEPSQGFIAWRAYAANTPDLPCGQLIARGTPHLTPAEIAAYDAPFPDVTYKAGAQRFPQLVPTHADDPFAILSREAETFWRDRWTGESFMAVGDADPVLGPDVMARVRAAIRGCPEPLIIKGGGHFVQEWGEDIAKAAIAAFGGRA
ncbi:MAG: haloalkane dehalogenase [Hyphomonadaceae bacterium]|nr:haloalkane dehalogenase [Hyphomonadaceae bacterium]